MARTSLRNALALIGLLWVVLATLFGVLLNSSEAFLGFNRLAWFFVLYALGAYLRLYPPRWLGYRALLGALMGAGVALWAASILVIASHPNFFARLGLKEWAYFWHPNTIPTVMVSVGLFGLFRAVDIGRSRIVNRIASTCLGIYLFHDGVLTSFIWGRLALKGSAASPWLLPMVLAGAVAVFATGCVIDLCRQALCSASLDRWLASASFERLCHRLRAWAERGSRWLLD